MMKGVNNGISTRLRQHSLLKHMFYRTIYRHYSTAIWTSFIDFGHMECGRPNYIFVYIYVEQKFKFFVDYDKQSRNFHYKALKTLKMLWLPALRQ